MNRLKEAAGVSETRKKKKGRKGGKEGEILALTCRLPCYFPSTIPQDTSQDNHNSLLQTCVCQQIDGVADNAKKRRRQFLEEQTCIF